MEPEDIAAVVDGFAAAGAAAVEAGCDGVEINAGQHSLVRQFLSGLTNHRGDEWGSRPLAVRPDGHRRGRAERSGPTPSSGSACPATSSPRGPASRRRWLRPSPPASSPPASTTSSSSAGRSSPPSRPGPTSTSRRASTPSWRRACARPSTCPSCSRVPSSTPVRPSGRSAGTTTRRRCDAVEMTRAQIADPDLVAKLRAGRRRAHPTVHPLQPDVPGPRRPQPVGDVRRRADLRSGDRGPRLVRRGARPARRDGRRRRAGRAGGGACRRHAWPPRRARRARAELGGLAAVAGPNAPLVDWLVGEVGRLGVEVRTRHRRPPTAIGTVVQCTGSIAGAPRLRGRRRRRRPRRRRAAPRRGDAPR